MGRYPFNHPSYYYYHHHYGRHLSRGRWFGFSHLFALGIGLWAGSHWARRCDGSYYNYWRHHSYNNFHPAVEAEKKDLTSMKNSFPRNE